jgi:hypothetical protein
MKVGHPAFIIWEMPEKRVSVVEKHGKYTKKP